MHGKFISRNEVMAIQSPAFTKTWHPYSHKDVILAMESITTKVMQVGIVSDRYSVTKDGHNMFGTFTLDIGANIKIQLGFRNSTNKSFALGVCSGTHVVVCSNKCFSGKFLEFRKHTGTLDLNELLSISYRNAQGAIEEGTKMINWQYALSEFPLDETNYKSIVYDAMCSEVIPPSSFNNFISAWGEEVSLSGNKSLYEFHGAVTRMNREASLFTTERRTAKLNELCKEYEPIIIVN